eukprot:175320_1
MGNRQRSSSCDSEDEPKYKDINDKNILKTKVNLNEIKKRAINLICSHSELTDVLSKIIVDYLDFPPKSCMDEFKTCFSYNKFIQAMKESNHDYKQQDTKKWVITEKFNIFPKLNIHNIQEIYYYDPKNHSRKGDIIWTLIGKVYCESIDCVYFMLDIKELYTIGSVSAGFMTPKIIYSSTWNDLYIYGLTNDSLRTECHRNHYFVSAQI